MKDAIATSSGYRVQAILIDTTGRGTIETVIDSCTTQDYKATLDRLMKKHKSSVHYQYNVVDLKTEDLIYSSLENVYYK